ncbi:MAG: SAM-dependent methyltransferase [Burkholderia sp.]|nr:SAM-dependent methyltransferase [Burkholderia sp.]
MNLSSLPALDQEMLVQSNMLAIQLRKYIVEAGGWLSFSRFMEVVLYTPNLGYYSSGTRKFSEHTNDGGDFVTAPELSPLFAQTLARPIAKSLTISNTRSIIEFGAGTGKLALGLLLELSKLHIELDEYIIVDLSGELRERQHDTINTSLYNITTHIRWIDELPQSFEGVILCNEVLDSMPVRLFSKAVGGWQERGVVIHNGEFAFYDLPVTFNDLPVILNSLDVADGYVTETHQAALAFTKTVCTMLTRGVIFLIDYGFPAYEYYHPQRNMGTLMCHYRHHVHDDPFSYLGLQDITSHVEFTGIYKAGTSVGANLLGYTSQARFLLNAGIIDALTNIYSLNYQYFLQAANAVHKLISESEMGELIKVISFTRGIDMSKAHTIDGFAQGDRSYTLLR